MNAVSFYLQDDDHKEVIFKKEILTFTLQLTKS